MALAKPSEAAISGQLARAPSLLAQQPQIQVASSCGESRDSRLICG